METQQTDEVEPREEQDWDPLHEKLAQRPALVVRALEDVAEDLQDRSTLYPEAGEGTFAMAANWLGAAIYLLRQRAIGGLEVLEILAATSRALESEHTDSGWSPGLHALAGTVRNREVQDWEDLNHLYGQLVEIRGKLLEGRAEDRQEAMRTDAPAQVPAVEWDDRELEEGRHTVGPCPACGKEVHFGTDGSRFDPLGQGPGFTTHVCKAEPSVDGPRWDEVEARLANGGIRYPDLDPLMDALIASVRAEIRLRERADGEEDAQPVDVAAMEPRGGPEPGDWSHVVRLEEDEDSLILDGAWLPIAGALELKRCPRCGETALEGEEDCTRCGLAPEDDSWWREKRDVWVWAEGQLTHHMAMRLHGDLRGCTEGGRTCLWCLTHARVSLVRVATGEAKEPEAMDWPEHGTPEEIALERLRVRLSRVRYPSSVDGRQRRFGQHHRHALAQWLWMHREEVCGLLDAPNRRAHVGEELCQLAEGLQGEDDAMAERLWALADLLEDPEQGVDR